MENRMMKPGPLGLCAVSAMVALFAVGCAQSSGRKGLTLDGGGWMGKSGTAAIFSTAGKPTTVAIPRPAATEPWMTGKTVMVRTLGANPV